MSIEKTLYISDLDGTLLNSNAQLTEETVQILNELIQQKNLHFSVATARTPATLEILLKDIHIKEPIVIMNGVALYRLDTHQYEQIEYLPSNIVEQVVTAIKEWIDEAFIYTIQDNQLIVHYNHIVGQGRTKFYNERKNLKGKSFVKTPLQDYDTVIYFVFIDKKQHIDTIHNLLKDIKNIFMMMYKDPYSEDYLLEIFSDKATKSNGIKKLKEMTHFDKMICFGDQINDKDMFSMADEAYAVSNANPEIKKLATDIIGSQDEDSVAKFIKERI